MFNINFASKPVQWFTLLFLALTWGSSFILMKRALVYFDSSQVAAIRMSIASLVLLPIALQNLRVLRHNFKYLLLTGLCGNALPYFLFAHAQTNISSSLSGMLNSLTSLFTLIIGVILFRAKTTFIQVSGVVVALVGAAGLIGFENLSKLGIQGKYASLVVLATALYGIAVNVVKHKLHGVKPLQITALSFLMTGPFCAIYLFSSTDFTQKLTDQPESWLGLFYLSILAIVGTATAVILFNQLISETTAVFASSVTYLIPIVAIGWGVIDGEPFSLIQFMFMLFILAGIFLINLKFNKKSPPSTTIPSRTW